MSAGVPTTAASSAPADRNVTCAPFHTAELRAHNVRRCHANSSSVDVSAVTAASFPPSSAPVLACSRRVRGRRVRRAVHLCATGRGASTTAWRKGASARRGHQGETRSVTVAKGTNCCCWRAASLALPLRRDVVAACTACVRQRAARRAVSANPQLPTVFAHRCAWTPSLVQSSAAQCVGLAWLSQLAVAAACVATPPPRR